MASPASRVKVFVRTRPVAEEATSLTINAREKTLSVISRRDTVGTAKREVWDFQFDAVMRNATQEAVFQSCAAELVEDVVSGFNATLMAYGQTGAGKTHTMSGPSGAYESRGIMPRCVQALFKRVEEVGDSSCTYKVSLSYLEIYKEHIYDLLAYSDADAADLEIMEDGSGATIVRGLSRKVVLTAEAALEALFVGETNRAIAEHQLNKASTRSHCVLTLFVEKLSGDGRAVLSKLHLVDLAGSERLLKTGSSGETLAEAMHINKSLTFLEQVVIALGTRAREHVPYRQTKLTNVLKDSLGGNCKTRMIACLWPAEAHMAETLSTLRFAVRMQRVKNVPKVNLISASPAATKRYEAELRLLRRELALADVISGRAGVSHTPLTEEQAAALDDEVEAFVAEGSSLTLDIVSVRQVEAVFNLLRDKLRAARRAGARGEEGGEAGEVEGGKEEGKEAAKRDVDDDDDASSVRAPSSASSSAPARPSRRRRPRTGEGRRESDESKRASSSRKRREGKDDEDDDDEASSVLSSAASPPAREAVFSRYKAEEGASLNEALMNGKAGLKKCREKRKLLKDTVNEHKACIDELMSRAAAAKAAAREEERELTAEEDAMVTKLAEAKVAYKSSYADFKEATAESDYLKNVVSQCRSKLVMEFERWYQRQWPSSKHMAADKLESKLHMDRLALDSAASGVSTASSRRGRLSSRSSRLSSRGSASSREAAIEEEGKAGSDAGEASFRRARLRASLDGERARAEGRDGGSKRSPSKRGTFGTGRKAKSRRG
eukprot:PLAT10746.2.p1 GENE.PLAT10746.2~~PLAT10746.2.p1  ORF type:complete len:779 (+),score=278.38 PLAT10746.2:1118-3454(+)